jgi:hypothetical protein
VVLRLDEHVVLACERLSLEERVRRERRGLLKEPFSCHRAQRLPVRSVAVTQGKGG